MRIKVTKSSDLKESDVTPENIYKQRRSIIKGLGFLGLGSLGASAALTSTSANANPFDWLLGEDKESPKFAQRPLEFSPNIQSIDPSVDNLSSEDIITSYNNFYEFGTGKDDPVAKAQEFKVDPWQLKVDGLVEKPLTLDYDDLYSLFPLEERIYRLRCVEAWSMVVPWIGFPLNKLIERANPLGSAKFVRFETLYDPKQMPGQRSRFVGGGIDYPYIEGLRLDEAMHPLTLMATGLYGKTLPPQNGAPIRLAVPWKYGFKSIKSVVKITLTERPPTTTWQQLIPDEYGFYANVNPNVDHPRWSQARERRIMGTGLRDQKRIATRMFNGYEEVASLYSGMDLRKNY